MEMVSGIREAVNPYSSAPSFAKYEITNLFFISGFQHRPFALSTSRSEDDMERFLRIERPRELALSDAQIAAVCATIEIAKGFGLKEGELAGSHFS
jgi:hypothetical protein